jgi:hypothetical protein
MQDLAECAMCDLPLAFSVAFGVCNVNVERWYRVCRKPAELPVLSVHSDFGQVS